MFNRSSAAAVVLGVICVVSACTTPQRAKSAHADIDQEVERLQERAASQAQTDPAYKVIPGVFITDGHRLPVRVAHNCRTCSTSPLHCIRACTACAKSPQS